MSFCGSSGRPARFATLNSSAIPQRRPKRREHAWDPDSLPPGAGQQVVHKLSKHAYIPAAAGTRRPEERILLANVASHNADFTAHNNVFATPRPLPNQVRQLRRGRFPIFPDKNALLATSAPLDKLQR
eukprot:scaffold2763_cov161-Pinguiococcus_pyrenoidosus.AAC.3